MNEQSTNSKWLPDIIRAFQVAGGSARFPQIYRWIKANRKSLPDQWEAVVRATVYNYSSDSPIFKQGSPNVFYKKAYGFWSLRYPSETVLGKTDDDFFLQVLSSMTKEQFESYIGKGEEFLADIKQQVEELKRKFKV